MILDFLPKSRFIEEFVGVSRILYSLLDTEGISATQWNVESTLSTICVVCSKNTSGGKMRDVKRWYDWICKLVEVILKKHRLRIEGHYHLLVTAMQSILGHLLRGRNKIGGASNEQAWVPTKEAERYNRLVTLICEPSAAAVTRSKKTNALESATDTAKRSAGRHMYLLLMHYVKLQLEVDVPHPVRMALEPGMNSIFDITSPEMRRVMNDGMDASGRAIIRELFGRYTKFGKWSGV